MSIIFFQYFVFITSLFGSENNPCLKTRKILTCIAMMMIIIKPNFYFYLQTARKHKDRN